MDYYIDTRNRDLAELRISGAKGHVDFFEILGAMNIRRITIPSIRKEDRLTLPERANLEVQLGRMWRESLKDLGEGDRLIMHSPPSEKFLGLPSVLKEVSRSGCRIITVIFDPEQFYMPQYSRAAGLKHRLDKWLEDETFRISDIVVAHTPEMKEMLVSTGVDEGRIITADAWDYLRDEPIDAESTSERFRKDGPVIFCGNLDRNKSGFIYEYRGSVPLDVYGPYYEYESNSNERPNEQSDEQSDERPRDYCADRTIGHNDAKSCNSVRHRGIYKAGELMDIIEGSFGLVWDGPSCGTCAGTYGEYLRYNIPHKLSLYLASGIPVVIWNQAALAGLVREEACGITCGSLSEIPDLIAGISDSEYEDMRANAARVGQRMRDGEYIRGFIEKALSMTCSNIAFSSNDTTAAGAPGTRSLAYAGVRRADCVMNLQSITGCRNALIVFTREPEAGKTKTRMMPYLDAEECADLQLCLLKDLRDKIRAVDADIFIAYAGDEPKQLRRIFGRKAIYIRQRGESLGNRMENAIADALAAGCDKAVLIGSDIPGISAEIIEDAFRILSIDDRSRDHTYNSCGYNADAHSSNYNADADFRDIVIGPSTDGGYYLIGMRQIHPEAFTIREYGTSKVLDETLSAAESAGLTVGMVSACSDLDDRNDAAEYLRRTRINTRTRRDHRRSTTSAGSGNSRTYRFLAERASISVIIPVCNEEAAIPGLLDQLEHSIYWPERLISGRRNRIRLGDRIEVIFVDGDSTDNTVDLIGDRFTVIHSAKGRGRQLNAGALASSGNILFFLHCDSEIPKDFAREIRRCMMKSDYGCFGVKFRSRNFFMLTNRVASNLRAGVRGIPFGDQGLFIDRELFFRMGMFPELEIMEDYEFALRMKRRGLRPVMARRRIVTSSRRYGSSTGDILRHEALNWKLRRMYRRGASDRDLAAKYRDVR